MRKEEGMQRLYRAQRDSRVDKLPRIRMSSKGERYGIKVRTGLTKKKVRVSKLSFIKQTKQGRALSCDLSFYLTEKYGKPQALIVRSMNWTLVGAKGKKRKEIPADEDACEVIIETLKEIAQRHKVQSIYASQNDIPRILLMKLGFSPMGSQDHMHLEVQKSAPKH